MLRRFPGGPGKLARVRRARILQAIPKVFRNIVTITPPDDLFWRLFMFSTGKKVHVEQITLVPVIEKIAADLLTRLLFI
jgi:hypothetical protein